MPATPRRKATSQKSGSPAQSLVGCSVVIPQDIFSESGSQYTGKVVGTPRRKKNTVYVKVDQDDTEYWFPADEVANWVVQDTKPTAAVPHTPRTRKNRQHTDSPQGVSTAGSSQPANVAKGQQKQALKSPGKRQETTTPKAVVQRWHDAASCHPENPDAFAETIEELVCV